MDCYVIILHARIKEQKVNARGDTKSPSNYRS